MSRNKGDISFLALILGILTGTIITLLFTPKSGKDFREDIKGKVNELPNEAEKIMKDFKKIYNEMYNFLKSFSEEKAGLACENIKQGSEKVKQIFEEQKEKAKAALEEAKKKIDEKLQEK